jgi:hypothetical protein
MFHENPLRLLPHLPEQKLLIVKRSASAASQPAVGSYPKPNSAKCPSDESNITVESCYLLTFEIDSLEAKENSGGIFWQRKEPARAVAR